MTETNRVTESTQEERLFILNKKGLFHTLSLSVLGIIGMLIVFFVPYFAPIRLTTNRMTYIAVIILFLLITSAFYLIQFIYFFMRTPNTVQVNEDSITFDKHKIWLKDVSTVKATSLIQKGGSGCRKIIICTNHKNYCYTMGYFSDMGRRNMVLSVEDFDYILVFLKQVEDYIVIQS